MISGKQPAILYDGYCNLCHTVFRFIVKHDRKGVFQYFHLHSDEAVLFLKNRDPAGDFSDSVILIDRGKVFVKSEAIFRILLYLGKWYKLLLVFKIFPKKVNNRLYDWIASNRYRWFGKQDQCHIIP